MEIGAAVRSALGQYATFAGRAQRAEFWWFVLFCSLVGIGADILDAAIFGPAVWRHAAGTTSRHLPGLFNSLWNLAVFLPSISVAVRRLHDGSRSGWWWWLWLVPVIGWIVLLIWFASRGSDGPNRFGGDPLAMPRT